MSSLSKKLSSILLCGSMAVTLLGNSGVHAANEIAAEAAIEDESEKVTAVDEHDDKVENDDKSNENTELDKEKEYQYVAKEDIPAQNLAKRAGSSFAVDVAKVLSTAALGVGIGIGANEGVRRRFKRDSSGNEAGGQAQAPIVSKDGTGVSTLQKKLDDAENKARELQKKLDDTESELQKKLEEEELQKKLEEKELQKKLEEEEKIYNFLYGAIGVFGRIPELRDMMSSKLGRDFDVNSKAAITGITISYIIGAVLFLLHGIKLYNKGGVYNAVKMTADLALPPLGFIVHFLESIFNGLFGERELSEEELSEEEIIDKSSSLLKRLNIIGMQRALVATGMVDENAAKLLVSKGSKLSPEQFQNLLSGFSEEEIIDKSSSLLKRLNIIGMQRALVATGLVNENTAKLLVSNISKPRPEQFQNLLSDFDVSDAKEAFAKNAKIDKNSIKAVQIIEFK